jgi:S-formylglutathione hydrolase FrmB/lysophospholipase L1-like esterase
MMLEGLGPPLQKTLAARPGLEVSREGRYATGLCRLDVFDWLEYFAGLLAQKSPDLVIITLGANDTQDIVDDQGRRHLVTTASWRELYGERVLALLGLAEAAQAQVLWIGLPVMGREPYNARALAINEVDQAACQAAKNCRFLDTWNLLAEDGRYATFLPMAERRLRVRAKDQIHLTEAGGKILTEAVLEYLLSYASLGPPEESTAEISSPRELGPGPENRAVIADPALVPKGLVPPAPTIFPPASQPPAEAPQEASPSPAATLSGPPASDLAANQPQVSPPEPGAPGPPPPTNLSRPPTSSLAALAEISLDSKALGREVKYLAYVPQAPGPFPAVFLLPGLGESHQAFAQRLGPSLWQLAEARRLLLVMVDPVGPSWYLDSPGQASSRYKTHFFRELLPHALARLPIQPDRLGLLGLGMGGHGALSLALTEPGRFGAIAALSPVTDLSLHPDDQPQNPAALRIEAALGPYNERPNLWRGASAYWLTRQNPQALADSRLFLSVGRSDQLVLAENRQYHRLLSELSLPHQYREDSGGHDWEFWARQLPTHLGFLAESLAARP